MVEEQKEEQIPECYIHFDFIAPGTVYFRVSSANIAPLQMLALAQWIEINARADLLEQRSNQKIQVAQPMPPQGILKSR